MKRKAIDELIKWKEQNSGKPILLTGAKGVGKTYLAFDFAKAFFTHITYLNFEREPLLKRLFMPVEGKNCTELLSEHYSLDSEDEIETRILILDEISCCPEAIKCILLQQLSNLFRYIIILSSNPVPVLFSDQILRLPIYPLEFDEFLRATGNEWYIELIMTHFNTDSRIPEIVHKELLDLHQLYLQIGGMPGAVNEYLNLSSTINISEQHSFLTGSYHDMILQENSDSEALKMNQVFDSLPLQLIKENKKFQYKLIRKGTTHAMYKDAIQRLSEIGYVIKCCRISNEQLSNPDEVFSVNEFSKDTSNINFKLYLPDTGLLYSKITEEYGTTLNAVQKKALLENYVAQSLLAKQVPFAFWESESMAKIDFIIYKNHTLIPVELHGDNNTRSKCISILRQNCDFPYAIKISSKNFEFSNQIKYVPYYAVFCI